MKTAFIKVQNIKRANQGFTLIELLVVIGILAILLAIVLIAINPARQFGQANDTKRHSDVTAILNAIGAYGADNHGDLTVLAIPLDSAVPPNEDAGTKVLCHGILGSADANGGAPTSTPSYISALPSDPKSNNGADITDCSLGKLSGYLVSRDAAGRVTVSAPNTEIASPAISVTR